jgi:hypothetical protein
VSPEEALQLVLDKLEGCGIDYMITGSFASSMHGVPRTTYDADIVIEIGAGSLDEFIRRLGNEFYASREAAREAVSSRSMFNVIHLESGFKIDFITRKARAFSKEEFSRREKGAFLGGSRWFTTPEDVILTKLEWSKLGELVRSPKTLFSVIPAKAGIQSLQGLLDSRLRGSDGLGDFLRAHQAW